MTKISNRHLFFALIGAGEFGNFAESVLDQVPEAQLAAVVDTNEQAAERLATRYNVPKFQSTDELLKRKPVDFVMINTPNDTHYDILQAALRQRAGVFCEKPLVIHKEQVHTLFSTAHAGQIDVDMVLRESAGYQYLKQKVDGLAEKPRRIHLENHAHESTIQAPWYWQDERSGGWFYTSAIHFLDIFFFLWPDMQFDQFRAYLDIDSTTGRATGYEFGLKNAKTEISVVHRFDTKGPEHLEALFDFGDAQAELEGWVPTKITWQGIDTAPFVLGDDREIEYRRMVARRLKGFLSGLQSNTWRINEQEIYRVSNFCELFQQAAKTHPNQWKTFTE